MHISTPQRHTAAICFMVAVLTGCGPSERQLQEEADRKIKEAQTKRIEELKVVLVSSFRDPQSAQYRNVRLLPDSATLCGEVNTKNTSGGYVGFMPFYVANDGKRIVFASVPEVELRNVAKMTKAETHQYIIKYAAQFGALGKMDLMLPLIAELTEMERFDTWRQCFV